MRTCSRGSSSRPAAGSPWRARSFAEVHQSVPGRRIAFATQNAYVFSGSLSHNLYYGLMHQPLRPATYDAAGGQTRGDARARCADRRQQHRRHPRGLDRLRGRRRRERRGARRNGARRAAARGDGAGDHRVRPRERSGSASPALAGGDGARGPGAHPRSRGEGRPGVAPSSCSIRTRYHTNISVAENLCSERRAAPRSSRANLPANPEFVALLRDVGLLEDLDAAGDQGGGSHGRAVRGRRARQRSLRPVRLHQRGRSPGIPEAADEDRRRHARRDLGRGTGAAPGADVPVRRRAASAGRDRRADAAQDRRSACGVSPPLRRSRGRRRVLRARPLQLRRFRSRTTSCSGGSRSSTRMRRRGSTRSCARWRSRSG